MAPEDDFVRITLRIPARLHQQLNESAAKKRSMNAEIISRLEQSFEVASGTDASDTPEDHPSSVKNPYYVDHFFLLLGPSIGEYLIRQNEYVRFVRNYADHLLQMDYKYPEQRLEAQLLASNYMISRGIPFPPEMDKEIQSSAERLLRAHRATGAATDRLGDPLKELEEIVRRNGDDPFGVRLPVPGRASWLRHLAEAAQAEAAQLERSADPTAPSTPTPKRPSRAR